MASITQSAAAGGVSGGTASAGQVAYWSSSSEVSGDAGFVYSAANDSVGIGAAVSVGAAETLRVQATETVASGASATWNGVHVAAATCTISGSTNITTATGFNFVSIGIPTLSNASIAVTSAASLYIAGAPVASGGMTITDRYALWVDSGNIRYDGLLICADGSEGAPSIVGQNDATTGIYFGSSRVSISGAGGEVARFSTDLLEINPGSDGAEFYIYETTPLAQLFRARTSAGNEGIAIGAATPGGDYFTVQPKVQTSGTYGGMRFTAPAHTGQTATAECSDVVINCTATLQRAAGTATNSRSVRIISRSYSFVSAGTVTNAVSFDIDKPPAASTNATFTHTSMMRLGADTATIGPTTAGMTYSAIRVMDHTVTVTGTTQVTANPSFVTHRIGILTIFNASAGTIDSAASLYIGGEPVVSGSAVITASYAIWVDAGICRFDGSVLVGGTAIETGSTNTLSMFNGTAPDNGVADTVQFYSSDNSAGNTIPSFYCEGTEVIATGQADSASSVRVKMRINGTVATFLCI